MAIETACLSHGQGDTEGMSKSNAAYEGVILSLESLSSPTDGAYQHGYQYELPRGQPELSSFQQPIGKQIILPPLPCLSFSNAHHTKEGGGGGKPPLLANVGNIPPSTTLTHRECQSPAAKEAETVARH